MITNIIMIEEDKAIYIYIYIYAIFEGLFM